MSTSRSPPEPLRKPNDNDTRWLLRRVWDRVNRDNEHFMAVIVGREGIGKSYTAVKIANQLDSTFNADRVIFDVADLLEELRDGNHEPGNFYVLDEAGVQFGIRTWQDRAQVLANQALQLIRDHNLGLIFTLPRLSELDSQAQGRLQAMINIVDKRPEEWVRVKWKRMSPDREGDTDKIYRIYPRRKMGTGGEKRKLSNVYFTPPADEELIGEYEANKQDFQEAFYDETIGELRGETDDGEEDEDDEMSEREIATEIASNGVEKYADRNDSNGQPYINPNLIRVDYGLSETQAQTVKSLLNRQYSKNELEQYAPARA